jgi:hypothetical protein
MERVTEAAKPAHHVVIVFRRQRGAAQDPVEQVRVGAIEQGLELIQLAGVQIREDPLGEGTEDEVKFLGAAMPAPKQDSPAAQVDRVFFRAIGSRTEVNHLVDLRISSELLPP